MRVVARAIIALAVVVGFSCGGQVEHERTATTVRGTYGDPSSTPFCDADAGADAAPDGC